MEKEQDFFSKLVEVFADEMIFCRNLERNRAVLPLILRRMIP